MGHRHPQTTGSRTDAGAGKLNALTTPSQPPQSPPAASPPEPPRRAPDAAIPPARLRDLLELLLLPAVSAAIISAATWLIWYYMAVPCAPHFADTAYCYPTPAARFINVEIWGRCLTYGAIGAALGGGLNIVVFTRERNARRNVEFHYDRLTEWIIEDREIARKERERDRAERQAQLQQQQQERAARLQQEQEEREKLAAERALQLQQEQEERELRLQREQEEREKLEAERALRLQQDHEERQRQEADRQRDRAERAQMLEMLTASHQQTMTLMGELIAELRDRRAQRNGNGNSRVDHADKPDG